MVNMTLTKPSSKIEFYIMLRNITKVVDSNYKLVLMTVRRCIVTAAESTKTVADSMNERMMKTAEWTTTHDRARRVVSALCDDASCLN